MARVTRAAAARNNEANALKEPHQLSSPPPTPNEAAKSKARRVKEVKQEDTTDGAQARGARRNERKRGAPTIKAEEEDELPHNLGKALPSPRTDDSEATDRKTPAKRVKRGSLQSIDSDAHIKAEENDSSPQKPTPKKPKKENYGLTPGISPYPDYLRPTPEECHEVVRLLEKLHGKIEAPKAIPPPSLDVAGCGEVPSVLDALVRTRLSANTTNKNSSTAFQGLVNRFGILQEGTGKGSVDWDAVRRAPQKDVYKAIERGGLADRKSKDIQAILQMVYEENQERKAALQNQSSADQLPGAAAEGAGEKDAEIAKATQNVISLDHLHLLSTDDAINKMLTYPGIGPKTASCVALFCLQRPSFAVDTHVFRLCQYLGWVPKSAKKGQPKVDRNTTYSHCDARIPDELKYQLHYLFVKHGKTCPRCRAITGQASADWDKGCPIEHLVKRHGAKKGGVSAVGRKKAKAAAADGGDDSELSDAPEDVED